jgi:PAS domain S-box-containing protein
MNKGRILVVDDEEATRYFVARTMRKEGYEVFEARDGTSALELAFTANPDLVVLDVRLPDINGFEVAERLRADSATRSIAILQLSASFTDPDAQAQGLQRGADGYLTHPVEATVLCATVHALLRMRRAEHREKAARERAEASENRYRFLAEMVPQVVWSSDAEGQVDYVNQKWFEWMGQSPGQVEMGDWSQHLHPEDQDRCRKAWEEARRNGNPLEMECRSWSAPAAAYRWQLIRALPMRDASGKVVRWFGTNTDVENQKRETAERQHLLEAAQQLAREREQLIAALHEEGRRKNEFIAMLSHELRNPLTPIRNSLYILEHTATSGDTARRAREVIDRQTQHMTRLIDDLLDMTRISRGKIRLHNEGVSLTELLTRCTEDHREHFIRAGLSLNIQIGAGPFMVHGDPTRLAQVIGNLLQNAAKFTPAGGHISVRLEHDPHDRTHATLSVRDDGAGIAAETLAHLFEPFIQADRTLDRSRGGLGLGLALAKGIVDLHGGTISVRSNGPGEGSEFVVRLPLTAVVEPKPVSTIRPPTGGTRRVLIIEDNLDAAQTLRDVLELCNHAVEMARDGAEGLSKARLFEPDVILCDLGLPMMDGYAVAGHIRSDPRLMSTFLVALSGYALQEDIDRSRAAGFDRHIAKPARIDIIEKLLAEVPARLSVA